jgi:hypothetical protein
MKLEINGAGLSTASSTHSAIIYENTARFNMYKG